jgi:diadenosine tetraphosphate (Ap4A) HIT family hydrolase
MAMNATQTKFGDPETRLKLYDHWVLLLRPQQVTLGALVLVSLEQASAFSMLSDKAFHELSQIVGQIEQGLSHAFGYDKINYLMLMMVDPDVHFHVIPRYAQAQTFEGQEFHDYSWPGPPDLKQVNPTVPEMNQKILSTLKTALENDIG